MSGPHVFWLVYLLCGIVFALWTASYHKQPLANRDQWMWGVTIAIWPVMAVALFILARRVRDRVLKEFLDELLKAKR